MDRPARLPLCAAALALCGTAPLASDLACTHPDDANHTFSVSGDRGTYTWDDHGIARSWSLSCSAPMAGGVSCHRWEVTGEKGRSVLIFRMLPGGTLVSAMSWALLDTSRVEVTPGFVCTGHPE